MADRRDLLASLYPVTRALRRVEDDAAATEGLTMWQYAILSVVREAPGSNQGSIARLLHYSPNRIIADLDHLEELGFIRRAPGADRRANIVAITRSGAAVQRRVQRVIHAGEDELLAGLSASQQRQMHSVATALAEKVRGR